MVLTITETTARLDLNVDDLVDQIRRQLLLRVYDDYLRLGGKVKMLEPLVDSVLDLLDTNSAADFKSSIFSQPVENWGDLHK